MFVLLLSDFGLFSFYTMNSFSLKKMCKLFALLYTHDFWLLFLIWSLIDPATSHGRGELGLLTSLWEGIGRRTYAVCISLWSHSLWALYTQQSLLMPCQSLIQLGTCSSLDTLFCLCSYTLFFLGPMVSFVRIFLLCFDMLLSMLSVQKYYILIVFLFSMGWRELFTGKFLSISCKNCLPMAVLASLPYGGLKNISSRLLLFFFLVCFPLLSFRSYLFWS